MEPKKSFSLLRLSGWGIVTSLIVSICLVIVANILDPQGGYLATLIIWLLVLPLMIGTFISLTTFMVSLVVNISRAPYHSMINFAFAIALVFIVHIISSIYYQQLDRIIDMSWTPQIYLILIIPLIGLFGLSLITWLIKRK